MKKNSETVSGFNFSSFKKAAKNAKVSTELRPEVITNRGFNKFTLNGKACNMMNIKTGDGVYMFVDTSASDVNSMFVIAKAPEGEGLKVAAAGKSMEVGRPVNYNYSGVYSQMIQQIPGAIEVSEEALVEMGLMRNEYTQKNKKGEDCFANLATRRVKYEVVSLGEAVIGGVEYPEVFGLTNVKVKECEVGSDDTNEADNE